MGKLIPLECGEGNYRPWEKGKSPRGDGVFKELIIFRQSEEFQLVWGGQ